MFILVLNLMCMLAAPVTSSGLKPEGAFGHFVTTESEVKPIPDLSKDENCLKTATLILGDGAKAKKILSNKDRSVELAFLMMYMNYATTSKGLKKLDEAKREWAEKKKIILDETETKPNFDRIMSGRAMKFGFPVIGTTLFNWMKFPLEGSKEER